MKYIKSTQGEIIELCLSHNITVIEDAAEAHGQYESNKKCGSFGLISTLSFYANKHITAGEGGALTPLMALGIPGDITAAIMLGALLMHDIVPGPTFIQDEPVLAYSIYIAFFLASFIMIGMQSGVLRIFVLVTRI